MLSPLRSYQDVLDQENRKVNTYIFRCNDIASYLVFGGRSGRDSMVVGLKTT
jgi:hypothetical protein